MSGRAFLHRMRVRYAECDPQGIVFNSRYLEYFDVALTEWWREALGPYDEVMAAHGVDLVVAEATIRYQASLRFDDEFEISAAPARMGTTSLLTAITIDRSDGERCADGEIRHVFVDPKAGGKAPIPDAFREALGAYGPLSG